MKKTKRVTQKISVLVMLFLIINLPLVSAVELRAESSEVPLIVNLPELVGGTTLEVVGTTEASARIAIYVNNELQRAATAAETGAFSVADVLLVRNFNNRVKVEAIDAGGNKASVEGNVLSDATRPQLSLETISDYSSENTIQIKGSISEQSSYEIFVNNNSVKKGEGQAIDETVSLEEGKNIVAITATDAAHLQSTEEFIIESDTKPPTVQAEIDKGNEYYEGSAVSSIHGKTKPGSKVYLYVYYPQGNEYKPDFKKAREAIDANNNGEFTFENVHFVSSILDTSLKDLAPRQVPSGVEDVTIAPFSREETQQQSTYHLYIIAEDKSGRTAYWQSTVTVHTCFSGSLDFTVESLPQFQGPLKLSPNLLDEGRQEIQAVFQLAYQGQGVPSAQQAAEDQAFRITSVRIEEACTQGMLQDKKAALACKILPGVSKKIESPDKTNIYVVWNLLKADELSKRDENFWNDFKSRLLNFPLKITISYQEREENNQLGQTKVQTSCQNVGYAVDIPIESKELIPDFLANEGVSGLNFTITQLQTIRPYIEKAYLVSGIGCMGSFVLRTVARWARIFTSKVESYYGSVKKVAEAVAGENKDSPKGCPRDQSKLYLRSTLENWKELSGAAADKENLNLPPEVVAAFNSEEEMKKITLEEVCPSTAAAWKFEETLDTAYRWTCDRAFCRAVPAGWTAKADQERIASAILEQQQCAATGRGVPLIRVENCQELIDANIVNQPQLKEQVQKGECYRDQYGDLYIRNLEEDGKHQQEIRQGIYRLKGLQNILAPIGPLKPSLIVYQPQGSETFIVGQEQKCFDVCKNPRKPNYQSAGCYVEEVDGGTLTLKQNNQKMTGDKYSAGYTSDCFIKGYKIGEQGGSLEYGPDGQPILQQCVCTGTKQEVQSYPARTAVKKTDDVEEKWSYQQDRIFRESRKTAGTYYPENRYYGGRDLSGAFGADYLLDYLQPEGDEKIHQVNPHTQLIGTFQSICLSGILKNMRMLESILTGLRNCLIQAKYTGLHDAGVCKTLFTQHVCGLVYKGIAYLNSQCSPITFDDVGKGAVFEDVGAIVSSGFKAIPEALESSVEDVRQDYGNAKLNEYFSAGAQGFAQSICLAAFGFEFPLFSEEFLLDAAYSFPVKTSVIMFPKEREFSTYNPSAQTAIYNYNIGGIILPGCKIRNWKVSLKCIGPEDLGHPGIDSTCGGQGCDCLNTQSAASPFESEKTKLLKSEFNLASGQMFDIPLESPLKINSHYRYDHVMVELALDPSEKDNAEACFDEGYRKGESGAIFYEPIIDASPPGEGICTVDLISGRYTCPAFNNLFGFGNAYFEEPFMMCWNKNTQLWVDCKTPNLFIIGDEIKVRVHVYLDDQGKCLKRTVRNVPGITEEPSPHPLPANLPGPQYITETLGTVRDDMFGGISNTLLKTAQSNSECDYALLRSPEEVRTGETYEFKYVPQTDGKVELRIGGAVINIVPQTGYRIVNGVLDKNGQTTFDLSEINGIEFDLGGFKVKRVLGTADTTDTNTLCAYQSVAQSRFAQNTNQRDITVTYQLIERDEAGLCLQSEQAVKAPSGLRSTITLPVRIQREPVYLSQAGGLHASYYNNKNYDEALITANQIIALQKNDLDNAIAVYYSVASLLKKGDKEQKNIKRYEPQIYGFLDSFFSRLGQYPAEEQNKPEFSKIKEYLCVVDQELQSKYASQCSGQ